MLQNTSALGDSKKRSRLTTACSTSVAGDADGAIFDVGMAAFVARDLDAKRVLLVVLRQGDDAVRQGRREQQGAAVGRRGLEDEFQILAKAQVEHLVGLVEHHGLQRETSRRPRRRWSRRRPGVPTTIWAPAASWRCSRARIHAADAGDDARTGILIEPGEFALHLQGQLAGRRDDQRQRRAGTLEPLGIAEQVLAIARP